MKYYLLAIISLVAITLTSCDDTTDTIGKSIVPTTDSLYTEAKEYPLTTESVLAGNVIARSRYGYVGCVKDPETNSYVKTNFMTQLHVLPFTSFPNIDSVYVAGYEDKGTNLTDAERQEKRQKVEADSCVLVLYYNKFYGDSLANMKLVAHELDTPYEESGTYYIDYDPSNKGMLRNGSETIHQPVTYTLANTRYSETSDNRHTIEIPLNSTYTDKDDVTYNNYGTYLMRQYYNNDAKRHSGYDSPYAFTHQICPGFYFENVGGIGSLAYIASGGLITYYRGRYAINDTLKTVVGATVIGATEEVMQVNSITQNKSILEALVKESTDHTYIKCPAGIFTSVELPVNSIMKGRDEDTLSTARIFFQVLDNPYSGSSSEYDTYELERPQTLLLIPTDSVSSFFANNKVCDNRTSFLATYTTSDKSNGYTFTNISTLITKMYNDKKASGLSDEEYAEKYPNWNKVQLIPVDASYSSSTSGSSTTTLTKVTNRMDIGSTKLAKGTGLPDSPVKVSVIYSRFNKD